MVTIKVGLIRGRHEMPVDEYILDEVEDVFDFKLIGHLINLFLENRVGIKVKNVPCINQCDYTDVNSFCGENKLVIYVTGLTAATAALVEKCARNGVDLTLMHYNAETGEYVPQKLF